MLSVNKNLWWASTLASTLLVTSVLQAQETTDNDMNGDEIVDVVQGEPNAGGAGKVTVHSGLDGNETSLITGNTLDGQFGASLTSRWDVDQDGFNDLLIAAPKEGAGVVYFYYGPFLTSSTTQLGTNDADVILLPVDDDIYQFGDAVAGVPDIDGDGIVDMLVRGLFTDNSGFEQSRTYVYSGSSWEIILALNDGIGFDPWEFIAEYDTNGIITEQQLSAVLQAYYVNGLGGGSQEEGGGGENMNFGGCECPADISSPTGEPDGVVDVSDMMLVLSQWDCTDPPNTCSADINGDGVVDTTDLLAVIDAWGNCDSDGDGMPDNWETDNGLDLCDPADSSGDPDADGLINVDEYINGSNPNNPDTDGDGVSDGAEVIGGSDPNDASDGGVGPNSENVLYVKLYFGDHSCHFSETWRMSFGGTVYEFSDAINAGCQEPQGSPGNCDDPWDCPLNAPRFKGPIAIERGQSFSINMDWVQTSYIDNPPDYDWTCNVYLCEADGSNAQELVEFHANGPGFEDDEWLPTEPIDGVYVVDPNELMGEKYTNASSDPTTTLTANLFAYAVDLTVFRPMNPPIRTNYYQVPDEIELESNDPQVFAGAGIRFNGDDDDVDGILDNWDTNGVVGEDDLIRIYITGQHVLPPDLELVLHNNSSDIRLWLDEQKGTELNFDANGNASVNNKQFYFVECISPTLSETTLELGIRKIGSSSVSVLDTVLFHRFESVIIVLGGENQVPTDPVNVPGNHGTFEIAIDLYDQGYNVFMFDEDVVSNDGSGLAYVLTTNLVLKQAISEIAIFGYSHGGGSTYHLSERLMTVFAGQGLFSIPFTSYVDAVENDSDIDVNQELRLPLGSLYHLNQYQNGTISDGWLDGGPITGSNPLPTGLDVETTVWGLNALHGTVDDYIQVTSLIETSLKTRVGR